MTRQQMTGNAGDSSPARARPRFTSRAAVLVVVVCAIALSLAYPVREYLAASPRLSSMRSSWLYFATRSDLAGAPVLI